MTNLLVAINGNRVKKQEVVTACQKTGDLVNQTVATGLYKAGFKFVAVEPAPTPVVELPFQIFKNEMFQVSLCKMVSDYKIFVMTTSNQLLKTKTFDGTYASAVSYAEQVLATETSEATRKIEANLKATKQVEELVSDIKNSETPVVELERGLVTLSGEAKTMLLTKLSNLLKQEV